MTSAKIINSNIDIDYLADLVRTSYYGNKRPVGKTHEDNITTLKNCFNGGHLSVFEFPDVTFEIHCPIFVARQLMRYRLNSYLEMSLRRTKPEKIICPQSEFEINYNNQVDLYNFLIESGYKKEDARQVLPLSTETVYICKINLRSLFHMFDERLHKSTQHQTRKLVSEMRDQLATLCPDLFEIAEKYKNNSNIEP